MEKTFAIFLKTLANGYGSNLLAIESKKTKETIEAVLKNLFHCLY